MAFPNDLDTDKNVGFTTEEGEVQSISTLEVDDVSDALHQKQSDDLSGDASKVKKFFDYMSLHILIPWINAIVKFVNKMNGNTSTSLGALENKLTALSGNTKASVEDLETRIDSVEKVSAVSTAKVEAATDLARAAAENVMQKDQCASVLDLIKGTPMYFGSGTSEDIEAAIPVAPGTTAYFDETDTSWEDLVDSVNAHHDNEENPHSVTYEQVGAAPAEIVDDVEELKMDKAPAGYVDAQYIISTNVENPNQMLEDIIQEVYSSMPNGTIKCILLSENVGTTDLWGGNHFLTFYKTNDLYGCLKAVKYNPNRVETRERSLYGGVWNEWCVDHPAMNLGVEYRTTERWKGMPVYRKLISYEFKETIEAASSYADVKIETGIKEAHQAVRCSAVTDSNAFLPFVAQTGGVTSIVRCEHNKVTLRIYKDTWSAGMTVDIELAYVKS